jgi:hypothetical protein
MLFLWCRIATIQPACLPTLATTDAGVNGWPFSVVGWGKTQNSTTISPVLNQLGYIVSCSVFLGLLIFDGATTPRYTDKKEN